MTSRDSRIQWPPLSRRSLEAVPPRSTSNASREFKTDKDPVYVTVPQAEYYAYKAAAEKYGMYQVLCLLTLMLSLLYQGRETAVRRRRQSLTDSSYKSASAITSFLEGFPRPSSM